MTSTEYLKQLLAGNKPPGHFMMPLVKQFCTVNTAGKYGEYSLDYHVLTRCQLEIIERYPIDIFNVLGYPYREAADCGLSVEFPEDGQPVSEGVLIHSRDDLERIYWPDPREGRLMANRIAACREFKRLRPDIVMMGACEAPFAQACTFLGIERAMMLLYEDPQFLLDVMERIEPLELDFCMAQIEAGAEMIFMGDSLASQVNPHFYEDYILDFEKRITQNIQAYGVPVRLHICGDITSILCRVASTEARFIDIDFPVDITDACRAVARVSPTSYVVGNFHPVQVLLNGSPEEVRRVCRNCESEAAAFNNFILAPGCEVPPATPVDNYQTLLEFGWKAKVGETNEC
ncbi:MAG: hypothetical protein JXM70_16495 [Pirellulales bacterium]|nr:hypothetical protein [Pirellulales bacterium]